MVRVVVRETRPGAPPLGAGAERIAEHALQAAAARLDVDLNAMPTLTWIVLLMAPSRMTELLRDLGRTVLPDQAALDLTWPTTTAVADLDDLTVLCHGAGHWLGHHALGVSCVSPLTWRESEGLAVRAEGPTWPWLARLIGRPDPGAAFLG